MLNERKTKQKPRVETHVWICISHAKSFLAKHGGRHWVQGRAGTWVALITQPNRGLVQTSGADKILKWKGDMKWRHVVGSCTWIVLGLTSIYRLNLGFEFRDDVVCLDLSYNLLLAFSGALYVTVHHWKPRPEHFSFSLSSMSHQLLTTAVTPSMQLKANSLNKQTNKQTNNT